MRIMLSFADGKIFALAEDGEGGFFEITHRGARALAGYIIDRDISDVRHHPSLNAGCVSGFLADVYQLAELIPHEEAQHET